MSKDTIYRQAAIDAMTEFYKDLLGDEEPKLDERTALYVDLKLLVERLPSAQPERKRGKWTEKHHAYSDEESVIEEWQSCRCSECGRYDTRPYMYYFSEPNYCSYCGADMRGEQDG